MKELEELKALLAKGYVSPTSPLKEINSHLNHDNNEQENSPYRRKHKATSEIEPAVESPNSSRVKKLKIDSLTNNEDLITFFIGQIARNFYDKAITTLQNLSENIENLDNQQAELIAQGVKTLSERLSVDDSSFEHLQNVFGTLLASKNSTLNNSEMQSLYSKNQLTLNYFKLNKAILSDDYKTAIDLFIDLSSDNPRRTFSENEIITIYKKLYTNSSSSQNSYKLDALQSIMAYCIETSEKTSSFSAPGLQETYYYNQALLHADKQEHFLQIMALSSAVTIAGNQLKQQVEQPEQQQQTAVRIHQYLADIEKISANIENVYAVIPVAEDLITDLLTIKNNLEECFLHIAPKHCTVNDWKMIPYSYYTPEAWTIIYNTELKEIKTAPQTTPARIQTLITLMQFDQVSDPAITFLRLITLYQRLFNFYQKDHTQDNTVALQVMLKNMQLLSTTIEENVNISLESKEALKQTQQTFLLTTAFKASVSETTSQPQDIVSSTSVSSISNTAKMSSY